MPCWLCASNASAQHHTMRRQNPASQQGAILELLLFLATSMLLVNLLVQISCLRPSPMMRAAPAAFLTYIPSKQQTHLYTFYLKCVFTHR